MASPKTDMILECHRLIKNYSRNKGEISVLKGIDLSIRRGEVIIIRGKSGAGKTTLIEILGGISRPTSGSVIFDGQRLEELSNEQSALMRRRKIGIIFQSFHLIPTWTAFENVEAAYMHSGISKSCRQEKVKRLLKEIGLMDKADYLPSELSMGQQQRVAIARALAHEPLLILADEPTGELDQETATEVLDYLMTPVRQKKITLIVATHGVFPIRFADRLCDLKEGLIRKSAISHSHFPKHAHTFKNRQKRNLP